MAKKFKRDTFVSASELAQVAHCPHFYYLNINRAALSEAEKKNIKRGNYMHQQMSKNASGFKKIYESEKDKPPSLIVRFWRWLVESVCGK